jgi:MFS family permease
LSSHGANFVAAAALVLPLLFALGHIQPPDVHFGRASGVPDHQGPTAPPRAWFRSLWTNSGLLTFAGCIFLFQMANASMLPLAGEALVYSKVALSPLIVSALIMVPRVIVAPMAPWAGRRAKMWGRRPLLLVGFAALPIRARLFAWTTNPIILIAAQLLDGVSGTMLGVLTAVIVADLTAGTGRFNLAQGFVGTVSGVGASLSTTVSSLVVASLGRVAGFLGIAAVALSSRAAILTLKGGPPALPGWQQKFDVYSGRLPGKLAAATERHKGQFLDERTKQVQTRGRECAIFGTRLLHPRVLKIDKFSGKVVIF